MSSLTLFSFDENTSIFLVNMHSEKIRKMMYNCSRKYNRYDYQI